MFWCLEERQGKKKEERRIKKKRERVRVWRRKKGKKKNEILSQYFHNKS